MFKHSGKSGRRSNPTLAAQACVVVLVALLVPSPPAGANNVTFAETVRFDRCHDQPNFVSVPIATAQEEVPQGYTVSPTHPGGATTELQLSELRCDSVTVGDTVVPRPVSMAFATFPLAGAPEGSADDPSVGDAYLLFFSTDSKPLADWLRAGTGLEAYYVPEMVYDYIVPEPFGEAPFYFAAPAPPAWAFTVEGRASAQHQVPAPIAEAWAWQDTKTPDGNTWRVTLAALAHDNYLAPAEVTIRAAPGSEMERIMPTNPAVPSFAASGRIDRWDAVKTRTVLRR